MFSLFTADRPAQTHLFQVLASARPHTIRVDANVLVGAGVFQSVKVGSQAIWYDPEHSELSECGTKTAYRAVTRGGDLVWFVTTSVQKSYVVEVVDASAALAADPKELARPWWGYSEPGRQSKKRVEGFEAMC